MTTIRGMIFTVILTVAVSLFLPSSALGDFREGLGEHCGYGLLDLTTVTPHTNWAKPLVGGSVKALVMSPFKTQRETIELASRLDLDVSVWMSVSDKDADGSKEGTRSKDAAISHFYAPAKNILKALEEAMAKDYDVYITGKLYWDTLPVNHRDEIIRRVKAGAGLVFIQPPIEQPEAPALIEKSASQSDRLWILHGAPIEKISLFQNVSADKLLQIGAVGAGRLAVVNYGEPYYTWKQPIAGGEVLIRENHTFHGLTPTWDDPHGLVNFRGTMIKEPLEDMDIPYEYAQSFLSRVVLWAAKRSSSQQVRIVPIENFARDKAAPPVKVVMKGQGAKDLRVEVSLRTGADSHKVLFKGAATSKGIQVQLPRLPKGRHYVDVWLKDGDKIVDWSSIGFDVTAKTICKEIIPTKKRFDRGKNVTGKVVFARPLLKDESAILEIEDNLGWVRARQILKTYSKTKVEFSVPMADTPVTMNTVRVKIMRGEDELERTEQPVYLFDRTWGEDYRVVAWGAGAYNARPREYICSQTRALGIDVLDLGCNSTPFQTHPAGRTAKTIPIGNQCIRMRAKLVVENNLDVINYGWGQLGDVAVHKKGIFSAEAGKSDGEQLWPYGCYAYINSEPFAAGKEFEPKGQMKMYHAYLRKVYGNIGAMNKSWGTNYADFGSAEFIPLDKARETGRFAQWADFRLFMEKAFSGKMKDIGEDYLRGDPQARHGFDAILFGNAWDGIDAWQMAKDLSVLHAYHYQSNDMFYEWIRSFARPDTITGTWTGSYGPRFGDLGPVTKEFPRYYPWATIFHGLNSGWWWTTAYGPGPSAGDPSWTADGTPLPHFARTMEEIREIKAGPGRVLLGSKRDNNGIAILYSAASRHGTALLTQYAELTQEDETAGILPPLDQGVETRPSAGWLYSVKDWAALIEDIGLQYEVISYEELADGILAKEKYKVLVLPYSVAMSDAEVDAIRKFVQDGGTVWADQRPGVLNEHCKKRSDWPFSDVFGNVGWTPKQFGKGNALLLGSATADYHRNLRKKGKWKEGRQLKEKFGDSMDKLTGIKAFAKVVDADAKDVPPTEVAVFRNGPVVCVGLLRDYQLRDYDEYDVKLTLEEARHVYDMRSGKYFGKTDVIPVKLGYQGKLYAFLPYKVRGLDLNVSPAKAGNNINVAVSVETADAETAGDHVFRIRLLDSTGKEVDGFTRNRTSRSGKFAEDILIPYNLAAGNYSLAVRDVVSGYEKKHSISLK